MRWNTSCLTAYGSDLSYLFTVLDVYVSVKENLVVRTGKSQVRCGLYHTCMEQFCLTASNIEQMEADKLC